jgi:two-component system, NarL family, nitrate/nitrite response regulator NarL
MTRIALFSEQPFLIAGFEAALEASKTLSLAGAYQTIAALQAQAGPGEPNVVLMELTDSMTLARVTEFACCFSRSAVVLWVDRVLPEFAAQAIAAGIRGILRRNLSIGTQLDCLEKIAAGELWVEKDLCDEMLTTRRVPLTGRERELVTLLAQGLKNKELAYELGITEGTVKVYLSRLFQKVGAKDRFELAIFALKNYYASQTGEPAVARSRDANGGCKPVRPTLDLDTLVTPRFIAAVQ